MFSLFIPRIYFFFKLIFVLRFVDFGIYSGTLPRLEAILLELVVNRLDRPKFVNR